MPVSAAPPRILLSILHAASCLALAMPVALAAQDEPAETMVPHIPATAEGVPIDPATGYATIAIASDVWIVTDGVYQAMFARGGDGVILFDAPPSLAAALPEAIAETTGLPVKTFVYSHSHVDHVGGAAAVVAALPERPEIVASAATAAKLARFADGTRPTPDRTFSASLELRQGPLRVRLTEEPGAHEPGNLLIYLPDARVLMAVDTVYPGWVPFTNLAMAQDVGLYAELHDSLLAYDFETFVGGHVGRPGTRADVETARAYIADLIRFAEEGRATVDFGAIAARTGTDDKWLLVNTYLDAVAAHCTARMMPVWLGRLGGVSTSTPGHCWVMQEFINLHGQSPDVR